MSTKKFLPCICTTLKNGETQYLLDDNKNIVFCTSNTIKSFDLEKIKYNFNNNKKQDIIIKSTDYPNDCKGKEIQSFNINSEYFAPEIIINDEISKKYNSADVNLNIFKTTKLFKSYFDPNLMNFLTKTEIYEKLNDNDKKKFAITLYYLDLTENLIYIVNKLQDEINDNIKKQIKDFNEEDYVKKYYSENSKQIQDTIDRLIDFKNVFNNEEFASVGGKTNFIIIIVFAVITLFAIIALFLYFRSPKSTKPAVTEPITEPVTAPVTAHVTKHVKVHPAPAGAIYGPIGHA
jgi:preprotein translocase subunit SecG